MVLSPCPDAEGDAPGQPDLRGANEESEAEEEMEHTEDQKAGFQAQFRKKRSRQIALMIPFVAAMLMMAWFGDGEELVPTG